MARFGAIVGHEISHFVDTLGAEYGADGGLHHWWTPQDMAQYQAACDALVNQFSATARSGPGDQCS